MYARERTEIYALVCLFVIVRRCLLVCVRATDLMLVLLLLHGII